MANTTGTYTTGLKDGVLGLDLGRFLIEQAYVTGVASFLSPAYFAPLAEKSGFAFVSGGTTYNLDDIYVRNDYWREGNLLNWGSNSVGELGDNSVTSKSSPIQTVSGGIFWKHASAGITFSAATKSDGTLWLWGSNFFGQLGNNESGTDRSSPVQTVSAGTNWWRVSCGNYHTAAIKTDGTLWLWGSGSQGKLGDNTQINKSSPVQTVTGGNNWKQVACGGGHTAAIKSDNSLWLWGLNATGQLGDNTTTVRRSSPVQTVSGGTTWKQVSCGADHTACIKTDNTLWLWGANSYGQLGDNTSTMKSSPVQTISGGTDWKWVACGTKHTLAIKRDGSLWCWGKNISGELGNNASGFSEHKSSPVQTVSAGTNWKEISAGDGTSYAIKTDGTLWCWGKNDSGQLGDNTTTNRSSPVTIAIGGTAWRKVAAGYSHAIALDFNDQPAGILVPAPPPSTPSCWVARLVYGHDNPKWILFRDWMLHESPNWFKNTYLKHGEAFAKSIENKPLIKWFVRKLMDFITKEKNLTKNYLNKELEKYERK